MKADLIKSKEQFAAQQIIGDLLEGELALYYDRIPSYLEPGTLNFELKAKH